ncbi:MAG: DUF5060 domain-containing protein [Chloroflexi bacterium]|nr:DUF5060 domain-containing protein [Chloroflexota bacterium]
MSLVTHAHFLLQTDSTPTPPAAQDRANPVAQYDLVEFSFRLPTTYDNPYDPTVIEVSGEFRPPEGEPLIVPGFFMHPYRDTCVMNCTVERLAASGQALWHVRFTPDQIGEWEYTIQASESGSHQVIQQGSFEVIASDQPGFVRTSPNGHYFAFDNTVSYFPIGENLAWSWADGGGIYAYERWLDSLSAAGANYARLNVDVPWFIGLDWPGPVGNYDAAQEAAWRMDRILELAQERGIYLQVTLIWNQGFTDYSEPPVTIPAEVPRPPTQADWQDSPYNSANGGPLDGPAALFTDPTSTTLLQQRLRYVVARWGYSPHVFAWEVVDEIDNMMGYTALRASPWLKELTAYLREVDPYDHLITAGAQDPAAAVWNLAPLDFAQVQYYPPQSAETPVDEVAGSLDVLSQAWVRPTIPMLLTEFSLNPWYEPVGDDPTGVHIRGTTWAAVMAGAAGGAMPWWWDTYIDRESLYNVLTPLALFTRDIPWSSSNLQPIPVELFSAHPVEYEPVRFGDFDRAFPSQSPPDTVYRLTADGALPSMRQMSAYLYGQFNPERSRPQTFVIAPPVDTELRILVQSVSSTAPAVLQIIVDGAEAARVDFSADSVDTLITLPISAGEHTLVLDNLGQDWLQLGYIELAEYRAPLRALALADRELGIAVAWVDHREYTWHSVTSGVIPDSLTFSLRLPEMPVGRYRVTFWDTATGNVIGEENITLDELSEGVLQIDLLPITAQLAVRAFRVAGPEVMPASAFTDFATRTPEVTLTATPTDTAVPVMTDTPTATETVTQTATVTRTPSPTRTRTPRPSSTPMATISPSDTVTNTRTSMPSRTPSPAATDTPLPSRTPTRTPPPTTAPAPSPTARPNPLETVVVE